MPFFGIITPTIQRESLLKTCRSIETQSFSGWQHVVVVDCEEYNADLIKTIEHPQRIIYKCDHPHRNGGNTCRHQAWNYVTSDYLIMCDDDNFLADDDVLESIRKVLLWKRLPLVAFFPILRLGSIFMPEGRPRICHVDTANLVVARAVGQWPDIEEYTSDGIFIEELVKKYEYATFPNVNPIVVVPVISGGR